MDYEEVLMIGGPLNGKRLSIIPDISFVEIPGEGFVRYRYHRVQLQSTHGIKTVVYVFGDIDPIAALIDGYRPSAGPEAA